MQLLRIWTAAMLAVEGVSPSFAQSNRVRAVAIDRVPVPPADRLEVEEIGPPLTFPWSLAFLPDGSFLVTEKHGGLRHITADGTASPPLEGGPSNVLRDEDSGLLDVALDPDFMANHAVYMAFAEGTLDANRTAVWKGRLDGDRIVGGRVIFRGNEWKKGSSHPGGRLLFLPDKTLLLTVGDGFDYRDKAQVPTTHLGKILRLTREGGVPPNNPFVGHPGYAPEIWTLGNRNVQGLTRDALTGTVWAHEHGPRGGDEINELVGGRNYGWPTVSFGIDYDGTIITNRAHAVGMADPRFVWAPSIAPSGLAMYHGTVHPEWEGRLLVGALAARTLVQVRIGSKTGLLSEEGRWLLGLKARIRDVRVAPDGRVYLLTDDERGRLLRLIPPSSALSIPPDSRLAPIAYLIGRWTGDSSYTPPFAADPKLMEETSLIDCVPTLEATYIRCTVRFYRKSDGRLRVVEHHINHDPAKVGFDVTVLDSSWPGKSHYTLTWDDLQQAWTGLIPSDHNGKPATELIMDKPSADRSTIVHTEAIRLKATPNAPWTDTFRWTWRRSQ